jgi:hypothetical protein
MTKYEVVYPLGRRVRQTRERAARPSALDGVTIGELSNDKFDSGFVFESIEKAILKRIPNGEVRVVRPIRQHLRTERVPGHPRSAGKSQAPRGRCRHFGMAG